MSDDSQRITALEAQTKTLVDRVDWVLLEACTVILTVQSIIRLHSKSDFRHDELERLDSAYEQLNRLLDQSFKEQKLGPYKNDP